MLQASQVSGQIRDDVTLSQVSYMLDFSVKAKTYVFCKGRLSSTNRDLNGEIEEFHVAEVTSISAAESMSGKLAQRGLATMLATRKR